MPPRLLERERGCLRDSERCRRPTARRRDRHLLRSLQRLWLLDLLRLLGVERLRETFLRRSPERSLSGLSEGLSPSHNPPDDGAAAAAVCEGGTVAGATGTAAKGDEALVAAATADKAATC